ncbi:hypothetical protein [Rhodanobacter geophilus]|uniref:Uncharacterized protein n=1 Tax=Rhodanobacter geophilus TaxID=3162488 RepID=A0ABV3QQT7_9GAMM
MSAIIIPFRLKTHGAGQRPDAAQSSSPTSEHQPHGLSSRQEMIYRLARNLLIGLLIERGMLPKP